MYYRLSVAKATIPPLRTRREDVSLLIEHVLDAFCAKHGRPKKVFTPEAMQVLLEYDWPGNGRQLRNVVETTLVCSGDPIPLEDLPIELLKAQTDAQPSLATDTRIEREPAGGAVPGSDLSIRQHERRLILSALKKYKKISLVARSLGISRSTLYRRLDEFGIDPRADSSS